MSDADPSLAVDIRGITKQFPGVLANDHVDFQVRTGEIHALVGENGAGKTTLMNILYGLVHPDSGEILIKGKPARIGGPRDAISLGIGMVHQHFMLIPVFSVGENIMLGREPVSGPDFYDRGRARAEIAQLTKRFGLALDADARTGELPVGLQQRAEIVKVLYRGADILILDEPTGVLTPQESKELFGVLRDLIKNGKTIIFISHKLKEVLEISDRITVMRRGKVVGHLVTKETNEEEIATMMVGRAVLLRVDKKPAKPGAVAFKVDNLTANADNGVQVLKGVSFDLHQGEILGIAGVEGNGQSELMEVLAGTRHVTGGRVLLAEKDVTMFDANSERDAGVAYIPEDRRGAGLVLAFSIAENSILGRERAPLFSWHELVLRLVAI
ncbi:MAG TPA: ABC transporter ATP-binding protein, partial [Candidatus Sulfotelmatobacter sp.]|nr:ABC transporter ATP-binding protein [Candidatus Sulfotelmatobacter sp.]